MKRYTTEELIALRKDVRQIKDALYGAEAAKAMMLDEPIINIEDVEEMNEDIYYLRCQERAKRDSYTVSRFWDYENEPELFKEAMAFYQNLCYKQKSWGK